MYIYYFVLTTIILWVIWIILIIPYLVLHNKEIILSDKLEVFIRSCRIVLSILIFISIILLFFSDFYLGIYGHGISNLGEWFAWMTMMTMLFFGSYFIIIIIKRGNDVRNKSSDLYVGNIISDESFKVDSYEDLLFYKKVVQETNAEGEWEVIENNIKKVQSVYFVDESNNYKISNDKLFNEIYFGNVINPLYDIDSVNEKMGDKTIKTTKSYIVNSQPVTIRGKIGKDELEVKDYYRDSPADSLYNNIQNFTHVQIIVFAFWLFFFGSAVFHWSNGYEAEILNNLDGKYLEEKIEEMYAWNDNMIEISVSIEGANETLNIYPLKLKKGTRIQKIPYSWDFLIFEGSSSEPGIRFSYNWIDYEGERIIRLNK